MSYKKLGFVSGQTLKADHLNHMEEGIAYHVASHTHPYIYYQETRAKLPYSIYWSSVTYGWNTFVAVSGAAGANIGCSSDTAAYSQDGISWNISILPSSGYWSSVTYGNKFVALLYNTDKAAYSEDGINWTQTTLPTSGLWKSVTYGNGKFVAISKGSNKAIYSEDGVDWTQTTLPSSGNWRSVTYGNGKFVAINDGSNKAAYSEDGVNWTQTTLPGGNLWTSVTYGNGKFVAIDGASNKVVYSEDGITWNVVSSSINLGEYITYGNGKFVAINDTSNKAAYSEDGINWTQTTLPFSQRWTNPVYGNGKFVTIGDGSNKAIYSEDGIHWKDTYKKLTQEGIAIDLKGLSLFDDFVTESYVNTKMVDVVKSVNGIAPDDNGNVEIEIERVLNENDKLLNSVLPDGYPYAEPEEVEMLLAECTVVDGDDVDAPPLEEEKTYTVVVNGVKYSNLVAEYDYNSYEDEDGEEYEEEYAILKANGVTITCCNHQDHWEIGCDDETVISVFTVLKPATLVPMSSDYLPKAAAVADVTSAPTAEQFNALLASLRDAGYLAQ